MVYKKTTFKKNFDFLNMNYNNEIFLSYKKQLLQKKMIFFNMNYKNKIFLAHKKQVFFLKIDTLYLIGIMKINILH